MPSLSSDLIPDSSPLHQQNQIQAELNPLRKGASNHLPRVQDFRRKHGAIILAMSLVRVTLYERSSLSFFAIDHHDLHRHMLMELTANMAPAGGNTRLEEGRLGRKICALTSYAASFSQ